MVPRAEPSLWRAGASSGALKSFYYINCYHKTGYGSEFSNVVLLYSKPMHYYLS
jgi:hypothetical protein